MHKEKRHTISKHKQKKKHTRKDKLKTKIENKSYENRNKKSNVISIYNGNDVTISACMMIKNEAHNLHRCLTSIKDLVDEIIIVDTGSTDKSIEICESYGAKIYYHPHPGKIIDSFSKYRNLSIGYATSDWVFIIDADEEAITTEKTAVELRNTLESISTELYGASILFKDIRKGSVLLQQYTTRLFRKGKIRYEGIVHNQPMIDDRMATVTEDFYIKHYGYDLSEEGTRIKSEKTRTLLHKDLQQNPNNYTDYFYLSQNYAQTKEYAKAVKYGEKYLTFKNEALREGKYMESIYYCVFHSYKQLNNPKKAEEWLNMGIQYLPNDLDLALALTEYGVWQKKSEIVMLGTRRFFELYDLYSKDPAVKGNRFVYSHVPEALSFCYFHFILITLHELVGSFEQLSKIFPQLSERYGDSLAQDFATVFTKFGMPELIPRYLPELIVQSIPNVSELGICFNDMEGEKNRKVA